MGDYLNRVTGYGLARWVSFSVLTLGLNFCDIIAAKAEDTAILSRGDAAVTAFSGAKQVGEVPPGLQPVDVTFIDLDGATAQIFDLSAPGTAPEGQVIDAPVKLKATAGEIGQVFAIGFGETPTSESDTPDIYLGATSAFGLQIVLPDSDGDGRPERVKIGDPKAEWMQGQFGSEKGGPGSVWRVDGKTGAMSLFGTIPDNSGPGLGDIVFDAATQQLFVSNLDDGLIYRLDSSGTVIDSFDHGQAGRAEAGLTPVTDDASTADIKSPSFDSEKPASWGFTQTERRVWGLGLRSGRLYYAVGEGPAIWSVSINLDGTFGDDPRREIEVSGTPAGHPISDIAFDKADHMYIAQRGGIKGSYDYSVFADAKQSVVWRFKREIPDDAQTPGIWVPTPDEYAIGFPADYRNNSGGIALGYGYKSGAMRPGVCDAFVWTTGDALRDNPQYAAKLAAGGPANIHGLQGNDRSLTRPDNEPPFSSYFVDYGGTSDDPNEQGHAGDVEIWQPCDEQADFGAYAPAPTLPPGYVPPGEIPPGETPFGDFNLRLDKRALPGTCVPGGLGVICDYVVRVTNVGSEVYFGPIVVNDKLPAAPLGAVMSFANIPPWFCFAITPTEHQCHLGPTVLLPGDSVDLYVAVDLPVVAPLCHLDNLAGIVWTAGFGDANPWDDFDFATATIPAAHCPPPAGKKSNLKIWKYPLAEVCADKGAHFQCDYLVVVRNMGGANYNGVIKVGETVPAGTSATFPQASWACAGAAPNYACTTGPVALAPNQAVHLHAVVKVPKNLAKDLSCEAINKAKIVQAVGGTDQNTDPTDDKAEATMVLPGKVSDCPGSKPLSNLKLFKTGPAAKCPVSGPNWVCEFKIKVQNFGAAYTSAIQFADALPFGTPPGASISFTAPAGWNCGGPVLPNLYQCSSANPNLSHLESVEIVATVKVPVAPGVQCSVKNNALITKAPGGTLLNSFAGDDMSSASATFSPVIPMGPGQGICFSPAMGEPEPPLTAPPSCPQGWSKTPVPGKCCPPRSAWDGGRCKRDVTPPKECPKGFRGTPPNCIRIVEPPKECPKGFRGTPPNCIRVVEPPKECPKGFRGTPPNCIRIVEPPKECPKGFRGTPPRCVRIVEPPKECPKGFRGTPPRCVRIVEPPKECPKGFRGTPPRCVRIVEPPKECPRGFRGTPPRCVRIVEPPKRCPRGFTGTPPSCKRIGTQPSTAPR